MILIPLQCIQELSCEVPNISSNNAKITLKQSSFRPCSLLTNTPVYNTHGTVLRSERQILTYMHTESIKDTIIHPIFGSLLTKAHKHISYRLSPNFFVVHPNLHRSVKQQISSVVCLRRSTNHLIPPNNNIKSRQNTACSSKPTLRGKLTGDNQPKELALHKHPPTRTQMQVLSHLPNFSPLHFLFNMIFVTTLFFIFFLN